VARYFFHLVDGTDTILDPEGVLIEHGKIAENALVQARSIIAGGVINGEIDLHMRIEVKDENDALVLRLPFDQAVRVIPPSA
jgi:hypothetical protein